MEFDFREEDDAGALCRFLRGLPEGSTVISIYARGGRHTAWFRVPAAPVAAPVTEEKKQKPISSKGK